MSHTHRSITLGQAPFLGHLSASLSPVACHLEELRCFMCRRWWWVLICFHTCFQAQASPFTFCIPPKSPERLTHSTFGNIPGEARRPATPEFLHWDSLVHAMRRPLWGWASVSYEPDSWDGLYWLWEPPATVCSLVRIWMCFSKGKIPSTHKDSHRVTDAWKVKDSFIGQKCRLKLKFMCRICHSTWS